MRNVADLSKEFLVMIRTVRKKNVNFSLLNFLAMYAGKLKQNIPTGPGTFFRKTEQTYTGEWMGQKTDGKTRWSFGKSF